MTRFSTYREPATQASGPPEGDRAFIQRGARAGIVAALAMVGAQLLWRLAWSAPGVQAFPELVVAALARLTPLSLFGFATENFGGLAKKTLFVLVIVGIVAIGHEAGGVAARLAVARRWNRGFASRALASLVVAGALLLLTLVAILPIANLGVFATESRYPGQTVAQLGLTFALYAFIWVLLTSPRLSTQPSPAPTTGVAVNRRDVLGQAAWRSGTVALGVGVGALTWRLFRSGQPVDVEASNEAARRILATAEARSAPRNAAQIPPTSAPIPQLGAGAMPPPPDEVQGATASTSTPPRDAASLFSKLTADAALTPVLTTVPNFYHVSKNISDPTVDGDGWTLTVNGLVDRPLQLDYEGLVKRVTTRKITTLCCISNDLNGDLISTAEWQGVPLRDLLIEAGVQGGAVDLKFRCADNYEDSIPVARGMDPDTLVVVGMNGEPLPPDHGYPARMIVPGIYGMKNVKWLEHVEAVADDFQGYWQTRGWSDTAENQIWGRIDVPQSGDKLPTGETIAAGVASAGDRGIKRVEVSLDDGTTWADATLESPLNSPFTWVRWALPFVATPGKHRMRVRVTDGTGQVASEQSRPPLPDGATGWPSRTVYVSG